MREEHPNQQELPDLPPGGSAPAPAPGSDQVREMSEVAALQAQVLDLGLVKESRPVFVFDAKLAKTKKAGAERQAKYMEKQAAKGLIPAQVPRDLVELVKTTHGGDWSKLIQASAPLGVNPQTPKTGIEGDELIPKAARAEIIEAGGLDKWVQKRVDSAIAALPPVPPVAPKIIEKVIEKPVVKLNAEQKKTYELGKKVSQLTGWRASVLSWLI